MRNFILGLAVGLLSLALYGSYVPKTIIETRTEVVEVPSYVYDTVYVHDTTVKKLFPTPFRSFEDVIFFTEYCKSESSGLSDDNWAVLKTMLNRVRRSGKDWYGFIRSPRDHQSPEIMAMLEKGVRLQPFSLNKEHDLKLIIRTLLAANGIYPEHIDKVIGDNVYYFESHPRSWNLHRKDHFCRDSIVAEYLHEFYKG
jgi:hypothetical protein